MGADSRHSRCSSTHPPRRQVAFFDSQASNLVKQPADGHRLAAHLPDDVRDKIIKELIDPKRAFAAHRHSFARNNGYAVCKQPRRLQRRY